MTELKRVYDIAPPLWGKKSPRPGSADGAVRQELRRPFSFVSGYAGSAVEVNHVEVKYDSELTTPGKLDKEVSAVFEAYGHQAMPRDKPDAAVPSVDDDPDKSISRYRFSIPIVSIEGLLHLEENTKGLRQSIMEDRESVVDCIIYANGMDVIHHRGVDQKALHKYIRKTVNRMVRRRPALFPGHSPERPVHVRPW